jgi:hypothetical protein
MCLFSEFYTVGEHRVGKNVVEQCVLLQNFYSGMQFISSNEDKIIQLYCEN